MGQCGNGPEKSDVRTDGSRRAGVRRRVIRLAVVILLAYLGACVLVGLLQARLIYFPTRGYDATPADVGLHFEDLTLKTGDATSAEGTGAHTVARLSAITPATPDNGSTIYRAVQDKALTDMQGDLLSQLSVALEGSYGVTINQKALNDAY